LAPQGSENADVVAGFATSAAETGASILKIMETTRHKSVDVLAAYVSRGGVLVNSRRHLR
jgi:hypothetical protein